MNKYTLASIFFLLASIAFASTLIYPYWHEFFWGDNLADYTFQISFYGMVSSFVLAAIALFVRVVKVRFI